MSDLNNRLESLAVGSTVSEKGQITLPKQIREMLKLSHKDSVGFFRSSHGIVIKNTSVRESNYLLNLLEAITIGNNVSVRGSGRKMKTSIISHLLTPFYDSKKILVLSADMKYSQHFSDWYLQNGSSNENGLIQLPHIIEDDKNIVIEQLKTTNILVIDLSDTALVSDDSVPSDMESFLREVTKEYTGRIILESKTHLSTWFAEGEDEVGVNITCNDHDWFYNRDVTDVHVVRPLGTLDELETSVEISWYEKKNRNYTLKTIHRPY